mmetsp:Transcript_23453/g.74736  ORF Transcript_23453/g.74736 Transcript_23453/m.74736 type:complete len:174 (-) Transcript_23453:996-1517(-)
MSKGCAQRGHDANQAQPTLWPLANPAATDRSDECGSTNLASYSSRELHLAGSYRQPQASFAQHFGLQVRAARHRRQRRAVRGELTARLHTRKFKAMGVSISLVVVVDGTVGSTDVGFRLPIVCAVRWFEVAIATAIHADIGALHVADAALRGWATGPGFPPPVGRSRLALCAQ